MHIMENTLRINTAATYNAAADHFDEAPLGFWERHGRQAVKRLQLRPGNRVLDAGCGTGASAFPAATAVGPMGHVTGIDVAETMLARARTKAKSQGFRNVSFAGADMAASGFPDASFDAVISVFSVFFVPDMVRQIAEFRRLLRPGGKLMVTVWGPNAFEPWASVFSDVLQEFKPGSARLGRPWERLTRPETLRRLLLDGGTGEPAIHSVRDRQFLGGPADFWTIAMGSGYRAEIERLSPTERATVRERAIQRLFAMGANSLETGALHAVARIPNRNGDLPRRTFADFQALTESLDQPGKL